MMARLLVCVNGHCWPENSIASPVESRCPICGAKVADTVDDDEVLTGSTQGPTPRSDGSSRTIFGAGKFGNYHIAHELGRGGMGIVYRAYDLARQRDVALKTLPRVDPSTLARFKHEFRALAEVNHPNVIRLYELVSDGDNWFFAMELVEGIEFLQYVYFGPPAGGTTPLDNVDATREFQPSPASGSGLSAAQLGRLRAALRQLASAVAALHEQGILHRDIKPSNVLVTCDGRVVLLDFGLAAEIGPSGSHRTSHRSILGTIGYMSPEQAAQRPTSPASDWYAVGTILFQSLTGKLPFLGDEIQVLHDKQSTNPPAPREILPQVPADLNDLCVALLQQVPERRPDVSDILHALDASGGAEWAAPVPKAASRTEAVTLVGRDEQLAQLQAAHRLLVEGRSSAVFISGRSGFGKSALVEAFLSQPAKGSVVLRGRVYEQESVPFKALDSFVDSLATYLHSLPASEAEAVMPRDVQALTRLFPVIGQVEATASAPRRHLEMQDQQELQRLAIGALRELLSRLGDRRPLVIYIDDLQWGDADSAAILTDLLQPPDAPVLLFIGTYRSEDAATSPFLKAFQFIQRQRETALDTLQLEVSQLGLSESIGLVLNLLGASDEPAVRHAEAIARESAGNPYYLKELAQHAGFDGNVAAAPAEISLDQVLWSRAERLTPDARRLLEMITVSARPLKLSDACDAARIAEDRASVLAELRHARFVRTVASHEGDDTEVEPYHDRVRESVLANVDRDQLRRHHLRLAEMVESRFDHLERIPLASGSVSEQGLPGDTCFDLAYHFDAAGQCGRALPYAVQAAERARAQNSLEIAAQQYRIAWRGSAAADEATGYTIAERLGEVNMLAGHYDTAAEAFHDAAALAKRPADRATIEGLQGELAQKRGKMKTAAQCSERALHLLGKAVPQNSLVIGFLLLWETFVQTLHSALPKLFLARRQANDAEIAFIVIRLLRRLSYAYWFSRGTHFAVWAHLRGMNLAERYPESLELAYAYANHAPAMSTIPWFGRGHTYAERSLDIRTRFGDVWGQGHSKNFHGVILHAQSRFTECIEKCREAIRLFERSGDYWEITTARYEIALSLYRLGDLQGAVEEALRTRQIGLELGDQQASGMPLDVLVRASLGRVPAELLESELKRHREDPQTESQVLLAEGIRRIYAGDLEQAAEVLEQAHNVSAQAGIRHAWVAAIRPWLTTARRRIAEQTELPPATRRQFIRRASREAGRALRIAKSFKNELPHVLREMGILAAMGGDKRRSKVLLDQSLFAAERQLARYEQAQTLVVRGEIGEDAGWEGASEDLIRGHELMRAIGAS